MTKNKTSFKKGHIVTKEVREKISKANKGKKLKPLSLEHKNKISKAMIGKNIGKVMTEEQKIKISIAKTGKSPNRIYNVSKKTKKKISKTLTGRKLAKRHKENVRLATIKRWKNPKYAKNIRDKRMQHRYDYKDYSMRSKWEVKVAQWLDKQNIKWEYESKKCVFYLSNGRNYYIDFYLPDLNKHIEVKGFWDKKSINSFKEAKKKLNMCIIDSRNIDDINLNLIKI